MKEKYLHLIWKNKRLPFHLMKLTNGSEFKIIDPGSYNRSESGPDFLDAKVSVNEIVWAGPIEIHVRASDWYRHEHHKDSAYDNVVLHVVLENDVEIIQNGRKIDCLELKSFVDFEHHLLFKENSIGHSIACRNLVSSIEPIYVHSMIERAALDKFERKITEILQMQLSDDRDILLRLMARAFGAKVNQLPFDELATRLTKPNFKLMNRSQKKRVVCHVSGLFTPDNESEMHNNSLDYLSIRKSDFGVLSPSSWKYKGLRPSSFPDIRVRQFAEVIAKIDFHLFLNPMPAIHMKELIIIQFKEINDSIPNKKLKISLGFIEMLIINCFAPFLFWLGKKSNLPDVCSNAFELLSITKKENNHIVQHWMEIGVKPTNALDSQGLIELYNQYCVKKKCLTCTIGNKILNR